MKPIFEFNIYINRNETTRFDTPSGKVNVIPFTGNVESELFTGTIRPGAADVQVTNAAGIRHMHAQYVFEGVNKEGKACHLFVDNQGYFEPNSSPKPFHACPSFLSDDLELHSYLSSPHFRAEGHSCETGVIIKIFDTTMEL